MPDWWYAGSLALPFWIPAYAGMTVAGMQSLPYVIPSVAEESKNPEMESTAGISDSSATLGMTQEGTAIPGYSLYQPWVHPSTMFRMNGWGPAQDERMGGSQGLTDGGMASLNENGN